MHDRPFSLRPGPLAALLALLALPGCGPQRVPPPVLLVEGLPVSGTIAAARRAGFTQCRGDPISLRCRRPAVTLHGFGPYQAAVDLVGSDGSGGFDQLTLWHDTDQFAVVELGNALEREGWRVCLTGDDSRGDQQIYTRPGSPVIVSIDISYWSKRRLRLIPARGRRVPCPVR
jgi:hypothetical protein